MTCPSCGARNTAAAPWCTQCLTPLAATEPASEDPAAGEPSSAPGPAPAPRTPSPGEAGTRPFRTRDGEVEWRCRRCGEWNALMLGRCAVCGTSLTGEDRRDPTATARTRRVLWVVAAVVCVTVLLVLVLVLVSLQGA